MYRIVDDGFQLLHGIKIIPIKPCKTLKDVVTRLYQITKSYDHDAVALIKIKLRHYKNNADIEVVFEKEIKPLLESYNLTIEEVKNV